MLEIAPLALALQVLLAQERVHPVAAEVSVTVSFPAQSVAKSMGLADADSSTLLLRIIRHVYGAPDPQARRLRQTLMTALSAIDKAGDGSVRVPLNPGIWQDVVLQGRVESNNLVSAILSDRAASLLYFGLSALDDETLLWLAGHTETLLHVRKHPEIFAAFGRSLHIRDGHVAVPGGADAAGAWQAIVGADPTEADAFVERLIVGNGRLALLYDTIEHLDGPHQRFALGLRLAPESRPVRLRALLDAFTLSAPDWRIPERPFSKPPLDGAIVFSTLHVLPDGNIVRPSTRRFWDRVFRGDALNDVPFERVSDGDIRGVSDALPLDPAWLADRLLRVPYAIGRRRLDALLFVQRVFTSDPAAESGLVATVARGYLSYQALMISLERTGFTDPAAYVRAAEHAHRLSTIESAPTRRVAVADFQSALALMERAHRARALDSPRAAALLSSLCALEVSSRSGYGSRFTRWLRDQLIAAFPKRDSVEETLLSAIAGTYPDSTNLPVTEWEGHRYRVDPASAELRRLQLVRERQGGPTLDAALTAAAALSAEERAARAPEEADRVLSDTLTSIVYAISLGDPEGAAVSSGNVALRHDFGLPTGSARGSGDAWQMPIERFDNRTPWRVRGSLLGLEVALSRLTLRRIDRTDMPGEPTLGSQDRQTVMLTAALLDPFAVSDQSRDAIAAAIARGRGIVRALADDGSGLNGVVRAAGLSEWRTQALSWRLQQHADPLADFSLPELYRVGASATADPIDAWGAAALPLTGCLCLATPPRSAWEDLTGYASAVLGTRGADVPLRIAETLADFKLPATLAPALAGFVTQDVIDHAQLGYPDDWEQFGQAVRDIPAGRMSDYIAALAVAGPLIEIK
jgi:hypothetical protein